MTLEEYTQLLESPNTIDAEAIQPLQDLLHYAPYCVSARLLLLKALYDNDQRDEAAKAMQRTILSAPQEVSVYFLLNPKRIKRRLETKKRVGQKDMTYFELIDKLQDVSKKTGVSFEELAQRYLEARQYSIEK